MSSEMNHVRALAALTAVTLASAAAFAALASFVACAPNADASDVCGQAADRLAECGASLPQLDGKTCSVMQKAIATCITTNATSCEALAGLYRRLDVCVTGYLDGGEIVPSAEIPSLPAAKAKDAGRDGASTAASSSGAAAATAIPSGIDAIDAGAGPSATSATGGAWSGFALDATVAANAGHQWVTATLAAGRYDFSLDGTGDADLYVRVGAPASLGDWDCRPFLDNAVENCPLTLTAPARVFVLVEGVSDTSSFTVKGQENP